MIGFKIERKPLEKKKFPGKSVKKKEGPKEDLPSEAPIPDPPPPAEVPSEFSHRLPVDAAALRAAIAECKEKLNPKKEENIQDHSFLCGRPHRINAPQDKGMGEAGRVHET